jgi:peptidoglycan/LPS O-acetylase OafA/YrhL
MTPADIASSLSPRVAVQGLENPERRRVAPRLTLVDGLRGLAATAVLFDHLPGMFGNPHAISESTRAVLLTWGYFGRLGVDVFFVLSGFVITLSIANSRIDWRYWLRFAARRSLRLDPPYWACLALCCGLLVLRRGLFDSPVELPTLKQTAAHLLYLQGLLGYPQINSVFWTLCIEFQLYLAFCALMGVLQAGGIATDPSRWCASGIFVVFVLSLTWPAMGINAETERTTLFPYICEFLSGSLAYWVSVRRLKAPVVIGAMASLIALGVATGNPCVATAGSAALLLVAASVYGKLTTWLSGARLQGLGRISYSLYLVHVPTFSVILALRTRLPMGESEPVGWVLCFLAIGSALAAARVFYALVEGPAMRLSHKLSLAPARRAPGVARGAVEV